jgi:hypothetical protein
LFNERLKMLTSAARDKSIKYYKCAHLYWLMYKTKKSESCDRVIRDFVEIEEKPFPN